MKLQFKITAIAIFMGASAFAQQFSNLVTSPSTRKDVVRVKYDLAPNGDTLDRVGHLENGTWADGYGKWSVLGLAIPNAAGVTPYDQKLYGLTVNDTTDRAFFGLRKIKQWRVDATIAWGDNDTATGNAHGSDRFVFEFHDGNSGGTPIIKKAMTLMPNGTNGVYAGIGTYGPTEQLHTTQGVRFQGLTTGGSPTNLVGIDANGKLWRTSITNLGNYCGSTQNVLTGDYEIPLNNQNFNFTDAAGSTSQVFIGYPSCSSSTARLDVTDDNLGTGIKGYCATNNVNNIGIYGLGYDNTGGSLIGVGVLGETNVGKNFAGAGVAGFCGGNAILTALPPQNVGVYGNATAHGGTWAGYFDGDVNINGNAFCTTMSWSDRRFKNNITQLGNVAEKIATLQGYTYEYKTEEFKNKNFPKGEQIGFIAQELKEVFPQLVVEDKQGYFAVNYVGFIPVLLQAVKEQQQQINELKSLVQSMAGNTHVTSVPVNLSDKNSVVLNQNVPNPFAESTVISYNIPTDFNKAQILFTTSEGRVIKTVDITQKGAGSLTVFANDLTNGIYSYTLVVDGKTIDTKKMIKE